MSNGCSCFVLCWGGQVSLSSVVFAAVESSLIVLFHHLWWKLWSEKFAIVALQDVFAAVPRSNRVVSRCTSVITQPQFMWVSGLEIALTAEGASIYMKQIRSRSRGLLLNMLLSIVAAFSDHFSYLTPFMARAPHSVVMRPATVMPNRLPEMNPATNWSGHFDWIGYNNYPIFIDMLSAICHTADAWRWRSIQCNKELINHEKGSSQQLLCTEKKHHSPNRHSLKDRKPPWTSRLAHLLLDRQLHWFHFFGYKTFSAYLWKFVNLHHSIAWFMFR